MSKLDRLPRYSNGRPSTWHDMSHDFKFTLAGGHLVPFQHDVLLPGDYIEINPSFEVRCAQPLLSAAMVDIDFHVDHFFVPFTMLFSPFESFVYGINEFYSSMSGNLAGAQNLPLFNFQQLGLAIRGNAGNPVAANVYERVGQSVARLFDMLGYSGCFVSNYSTSVELAASDYGGFIPNIFPYALFAYNCIYENYFRDDSVTKFHHNDFNVDGLASNASSVQLFSFNNTSPTIYPAAIPVYCIKYRPMYKDYYMSAKRSPLVDELNLSLSLNGGTNNSLLRVYQDVSSNRIGALFRPHADLVSPNTDYASGDGNSSSPVTSYNDFGVYDGIDVLDKQSTNQLRTLFANEKLLMVTARARKNYDAQTLAHFGVDVPHDVKHDLTHIGHDVFSMRINELVSTADTLSSDGASGSPLGEFFGKGVAGANTRKFKFTAPCHGVLMSIISVVPRIDYIVEFQKKNFIQTRLDFFQPEYDALGMQPLYRYEVVGVNASGSAQTSGNVVGIGNAYDIQGWQYRYEQFKRGINRVSHAFSPGVWSSPTYSAWALSLYPYSAHTRPSGIGTISRRMGYGKQSDGSWLDYYAETSGYERYVQPVIFDQLFASSYYCGWKQDEDDGTVDYETLENWSKNPWQIYARDPFVVNSRIFYKKRSIMSTYSMPKLD